MLRVPLAVFRSRAPQLLISTVAFLAVILQLSAPSLAGAHSTNTNQDQTPQALGSVSKIGEVYINDVPLTSPESTIFAGDKLRTGENGVASFAVSGRGTLKFSPNSFAVFAGAEQYVADLRSGTVVVSSFSGPSGLALRVGDFIVVPAVQEQQTTVKVERALAGAASVSCLEGSVSVISRQGAAGLLLQAGQSSTISTSGQLNPESEGPPRAAPAITPPESTEPTQPQPGAPTPGGPTPAPPPPANPPQQQKSRKGWIILGLAGAGVAVIAAAAAGGGGSHTPVSPSSP